MTRVLSIFVGLPAASADWWRALNIARIMKRAGIQVEFLHFTSSNVGWRVAVDDEFPSRFVTPYTAVSRCDCLRLLHEDFDLIYANGDPAAFAALLWRLRKTPIIYDMHGYVPDEYILTRGSSHRLPPLLIGYGVKKLVCYIDIKAADRIICVSRSMMQFLRDRGVPSEKMAYVTNGVDLNAFRPITSESTQIAKRRYGLDGRFVFGYIGGSQRYQGIEELIGAARKLPESRAVFAVTYSGSIKSGNRNLMLLPNVNRDSVSEYYSLCDVFVLPRPDHIATRVAAPTKFAEYTASGKPILTTAVGDAAQLVEKYDCGIVVKSNSEECLKQGFEEFLGLPENELKRMGLRARSLAEIEYDWKDVGERLLDVIRRPGSV